MPIPRRLLAKSERIVVQALIVQPLAQFWRLARKQRDIRPEVGKGSDPVALDPLRECVVAGDALKALSGSSKPGDALSRIKRSIRCGYASAVYSASRPPIE